MSGIGLDAFGNGFAESWNARHRGVLREALLDGGDSGGRDEFRSTEIGFADAEIDDFPALGTQLATKRGDRQGCRALDAAYVFTPLHIPPEVG